MVAETKMISMSSPGGRRGRARSGERARVAGKRCLGAQHPAVETPRYSITFRTSALRPKGREAVALARWFLPPNDSGERTRPHCAPIEAKRR
jgi:hypothetical protein